MYSEIKVIFSGKSWSASPVELTDCSAVLEVNSKNEWQGVDDFLADHAGKNIAFVLNHQLKGMFGDYALNTHSDIDFPLAVFLVFEKEKSIEIQKKALTNSIVLNPRISKSVYLEKVAEVKARIQQGDFYENNFCVEHFAVCKLEVDDLFSKVVHISNAPYSGLFQYDKHSVISGSPECFFKTKGDKISTSPIKGTRARGKEIESDSVLKKELESSLKERAENIMIVDLVRHDLSQISVKNSVQVDALCKVHSFDTVHQMISDVSSTLKPNTTFTSIIEKLFPIGSMTGAPKIAAVKASDALEATARCTYSGSLGWIQPNGDIQCNVLIRGFYYNSESQYLSTSVGGAITNLSDPEEEYNECMTKLEMMQKALLQD